MRSAKFSLFPSIAACAGALFTTVSGACAELTPEEWSSIFHNVEKPAQGIPLAFNETTSEGLTSIKFGDVLCTGTQQVVVAYCEWPDRGTNEEYYRSARVAVLTSSSLGLSQAWVSEPFGCGFGTGCIIDTPASECADFQAATFALFDLTGDSFPEIICGRHSFSAEGVRHDIWTGHTGTITELYSVDGGRMRILEPDSPGTLPIVEIEYWVPQVGPVREQLRWNGTEFAPIANSSTTGAAING